MPICQERARLLELESVAMTKVSECAKEIKEHATGTPLDEAELDKVDKVFAAWHAIRDQIKEHERVHGCAAPSAN